MIGPSVTISLADSLGISPDDRTLMAGAAAELLDRPLDLDLDAELSRLTREERERLANEAAARRAELDAERAAALAAEDARRAALPPSQRDGAPRRPRLGFSPPAGSGAPETTATTWSAPDMRAQLSGGHEPPKPTLMPLANGICLLYAGKTHSIHGESESGKSLLAQIEAARLIRDGSDVLYLDFEDDATSVGRRLLMLGASLDNIAEHFTYMSPEEPHDANAASRAAWDSLMARRFALVVIDGVTASLSVYGAATKDNDDVTAWSRKLPDVLASRTGAAVVMIDHVTKSTDGRGRFAIGAQAKLATLSGAAYSVDVISALAPGRVGSLALRVGKDRPGQVRKHGGYMRPDRTQDIATVRVDSRGTDEVPPRIEWQHFAPPARGDGESGQTADEKKEADAKRKATEAQREAHKLRERAWKRVKAAPTDSKGELVEALGVKAEDSRRALAWLESHGYLTKTKRGQAITYAVAATYTAKRGDEPAEGFTPDGDDAGTEGV